MHKLSKGAEHDDIVVDMGNTDLHRKGSHVHLAHMNHEQFTGALTSRAVSKQCIFWTLDDCCKQYVKCDVFHS
jgi:hypothetical protein